MGILRQPTDCSQHDGGETVTARNLKELTRAYCVSTGQSFKSVGPTSTPTVPLRAQTDLTDVLREMDQRCYPET
jgi:hypothetical protein